MDGALSVAQAAGPARSVPSGPLLGQGQPQGSRSSNRHPFGLLATCRPGQPVVMAEAQI